MGDGEALEVVIFRGFSSSLTHPTAFDPDQPLLPSEATINSAELLQAPSIPPLSRCWLVLVQQRISSIQPFGAEGSGSDRRHAAPADLRVLSARADVGFVVPAAGALLASGFGDAQRHPLVCDLS